jgi:hypothetical protein
MPKLDLTNRKSLEELNKLPAPSNEGLKKLFVDVHQVIIKDGGVYEDKALYDEILLTISRPDDIQTFHQLLGINEHRIGFYCMCLGTYAIELYNDDGLKATIGFHHGISIRYNKWNSDAELANSDELLSFLAVQGFTKPLADRLEEKRNQESDRVAARKWLDAAPKCFHKYQKQIYDSDTSCSSSLISDLNLEIPNRQKQIISLLQLFGKTEKFWTGYPAYEELPNDILKTFELKDIIEAYIQSDRNYKTRKGLGRLLCSFEFKKIRNNYLKYITMEVINDLEKCFEWLGDKRGINEIFALRNHKNKSRE